MPSVEITRRQVSDERSAVRSAGLLIDFLANNIQELVDRKSKEEDYQKFVTVLRTHRDQLAAAVARNTAAESTGEAEPIPAETPSSAGATEPAPEPSPPPPEETKKEARRTTVKSAAKAVGAGYVASRLSAAARKRRGK